MNNEFMRTGFFTETEFFPQAMDGKIRSFECRPVMEVDFGDGDIGIEIAESKSHADYWSVYARLEDGRAMVVANVKTEKQAIDLSAIFQAIHILS